MSHSPSSSCPFHVILMRSRSRKHIVFSTYSKNKIFCKYYVQYSVQRNSHTRKLVYRMMYVQKQISMNKLAFTRPSRGNMTASTGKHRLVQLPGAVIRRKTRCRYRRPERSYAGEPCAPKLNYLRRVSGEKCGH